MKKGIVFLWYLIFCNGCMAQSLWTFYNHSNSLLPDNTIRAIEQDKSGVIWIGTDNGLAKFDGNQFSVFDTSNSDIADNQIRSIAFDTANNLWVGTLPAGVSTFDGSNWNTYNTINSSLPTDQVRTIAFDSSNTAWIGTTGGVAHITDEGWEVYNMFNSPLGANNINHIFIDKNDTKWVGTVNGGISKKNGSNWITYNNLNSGLTDNTVLDLEQDFIGNLWFATPAQGLGRFNGNNWFYRLTANSDIPTNSITSVEIVKNTDIKYMGTFDKGLLRWNNGFAFDSFTVTNSPMPENYVSCLKRMEDGKLWIGTLNSGLVVFSDTTSFPILYNAMENMQGRTHIYPNPAHDQIFIAELPKWLEHIELIDMFGKVAFRTTLEGERSITIPVDYLPKGIFTIRLTGYGLSNSSRFVKE